MLNLGARDIGVRRTSGWTSFTQQEVSDFGRTTRDEAPFHMDPEWARRHSPYGTTIAYGFQTLAMLTYFNHELFGWPADGTKDEGYGINYGIDRVRFTGPVPVGARFRCHMTLAGIEERNPGERKLTFKVEIEVEGMQRPVLVADWIGMFVVAEGHASLSRRV